MTEHLSIVARYLRRPDRLCGAHPAGLGRKSRFGRGGTRDESGPAAAGGEADEPADDDDQAVLEADEVEEVHDQPGGPGDEAAQSDGVEVGDRAGATDRREIALVHVAERPDRMAAEGGADNLGRVATLLHRDRRDAGQHLDAAVAAAYADHVAERQDLGVAR